MSSSTTKKRRLSAKGGAGIALLATCLVALAMAGTVPWIWALSAQEQLGDSTSELAFLQDKLTTRGNVSATGLTEADDLDALFIPGGTPGLELAGLQQRMGELAAASGMTFERSQPLPSEDQDGLARQRLEIEVTGSIDGLRSYLHAFETGHPFACVNRATILRNGKGDVNGDVLPSDNLRVSLLIEAFGWRGTAK